MSDWRIRKRYGFGAGRVRLSPASMGLVGRPASPLAGLCQVGAELRAGGLTQSLRRAGMLTGTLGLGAMLLVALLAGFQADPQDSTDLQIVELVLPEPLAAESAAAAAAVPPPSTRSVSPVPPPSIREQQQRRCGHGPMCGAAIPEHRALKRRLHRQQVGCYR